MKPTFVLLALVILAVPLQAADSVAAGSYFSPREEDRAFTKQIEAALLDIQTIKPGQTRGDLMKLFAYEGGISSREYNSHFVYRKCPYIKVEIKLKAVGPETGSMESPADIIVSISKPYLEFSIGD